MGSMTKSVPCRKHWLENLVTGMPLHTCRDGSAAFPTAYHEKVIVRDDQWIWISSGNWTKNSQPQIDPVNVLSDTKEMYKCNREYHAIFEQPELAAVFKRYMQHDRDQIGAQLAGAAARLPMPNLFVSLEQLQEDAALAALADPDPTPSAELPTTGAAVRIRPVLSPDNYSVRIDELIRAAKNLYLQYSYITWSSKEKDAEFRAVLEYLGELSWDANFDLRVIVGHDPEATTPLRRTAGTRLAFGASARSTTRPSLPTERLFS